MPRLPKGMEGTEMTQRTAAAGDHAIANPLEGSGDEAHDETGPEYLQPNHQYTEMRRGTDRTGSSGLEIQTS
jgi:hypothetical protein